MCTGADQSVVIKNSDSNILPTSTAATTLWWKHLQSCSEESSSFEKHHSMKGKHRNDFNPRQQGPKSQFWNHRHRRQASLPTATSLLILVDLPPIDYDIAMGYYDPAIIKNDVRNFNPKYFKMKNL